MEHQALHVGCLVRSTTALATAVLAAGIVASSVASQPPLSAKHPVSVAQTHATNHFELLFSGFQDITDTWGKLHVGVTPVRRIRERDAPDFTVTGCFPLLDGVWEVFGQQMTEVSRGDEPYDRIVVWKPTRSANIYAVTTRTDP